MGEAIDLPPPKPKNAGQMPVGFERVLIIHVLQL